MIRTNCPKDKSKLKAADSLIIFPTRVREARSFVETKLYRREKFDSQNVNSKIQKMRSDGKTVD